MTKKKLGKKAVRAAQSKVKKTVKKIAKSAKASGKKSKKKAAKKSNQTNAKKTVKKKKSVAKKVSAKKSASKKSSTKKRPQNKSSFSQGLSKDLLLQMHDLMVKSRVLEERLIQIYKLGEAFFWIGGPGEEAFGVPLGLLTNKGQGVDHDYLHLHYRCTPTLIAMGMPMIDAVRLIMNKATDRSTGGRNFSGHYCYPEWNVVPVGSPIEVQYALGIGTAWSQKRNKAEGISIVTGGDAGTAEGEFASSLVWSSRPGNELPLLLTVQNNGMGISTRYQEQHGEEFIADRGTAFRMRTAVYNCNDPVESYLGLKEEIEYVRKNSKPALVECMVSRLNGHSSASGANRATDQVDCLKDFEENLLKFDYITESKIKDIWTGYDQEVKADVQKVRGEADPSADSIWDHTFVDNENADWRNF